MRKLGVFNQISVDGYFSTPNGDMSWAHRPDDDEEFKQFVAGNASGGGALVFGRKTYQMMASFWPTPAAAEQFPVVAEHMNALPKFVFSRTLTEAPWNNTRLLNDNLVTEMQKLKSQPGPDMAILGSGTLVSQLSRAGLIDEYQMLVTPVVLGEGRTLFEGLNHVLDLTLVKTRTFRNGKAFLVYQPKA